MVMLSTWNLPDQQIWSFINLIYTVIIVIKLQVKQGRQFQKNTQIKTDQTVIVIKTSLAGPPNPQSLQRSVNFRSIVEILIDGRLAIDGDTGKIRGVNIELDL